MGLTKKTPAGEARASDCSQESQQSSVELDGNNSINAVTAIATTDGVNKTYAVHPDTGKLTKIAKATIWFGNALVYCVSTLEEMVDILKQVGKRKKRIVREVSMMDNSELLKRLRAFGFKRGRRFFQGPEWSHPSKEGAPVIKIERGLITVHTHDPDNPYNKGDRTYKTTKGAMRFIDKQMAVEDISFSVFKTELLLDGWKVEIPDARWDSNDGFYITKELGRLGVPVLAVIEQDDLYGFDKVLFHTMLYAKTIEYLHSEFDAMRDQA